jgi:hypothetical protein
MLVVVTIAMVASIILGLICSLMRCIEIHRGEKLKRADTLSPAVKPCCLVLVAIHLD